MEALTNIIGILAAIVGTSLMLPQALKSYRSKHMRDVSGTMLVFYFFNCLLWLIYGILIISWPLALCNLVGLLIGTFQLILKRIYK